MYVQCNITSLQVPMESFNDVLASLKYIIAILLVRVYHCIISHCSFIEKKCTNIIYKNVNIKDKNPASISDGTTLKYHLMVILEKNY